MESKAKRKYLEKHIHHLAVFERLNTANSFNPSIVHPIAICIPIYNEFPLFFKTLRSVYLSLAQSLSYLQNNFFPISIVCCVNAKENENFEIQDNNEKLLRELMRLQKTEFFENDKMNIHVLNFSQKDFYFGSKDGVGLARKLALDYALQGGAQTLASLDADCLVSLNYIFCLEMFYQNYKNTKSWALTGFSHQKEANEKTLHAIAMKDYEDYLFSHSQFLFDIGSPYYPVALGPTIIVTSEAYVQAGGMNKKIAGEDFYFLQSLIKLDLKKKKEEYLFLASKVFPSDRLSKRVLFGTGPSLEKMIDGEKKGFPKSFYKSLKMFFATFYFIVEKAYKKDVFIEEKKTKEVLLTFETEMHKVCQKTYQYLEESSFWRDWRRISFTHWKDKKNLINAFFVRFDGLETIRFFNYLGS